MTDRTMPRRFVYVLLVASSCITLRAAPVAADDPDPKARTLIGRDALGDWTTDAPRVRRRLTLDDLPEPFDTPSADNFPRVVRRPDGALPRAPEGFVVNSFASGLNNPRKIVTAPNGDVFVAESAPGRIKVLRDADGDGKAEVTGIFASGLSLPFGIAFYPVGQAPTHVYIGNTDSVVRFAYQPGDLKARGKAETIVPSLPGFGRLRGGGHWTRDVVFSKDNKRMFSSRSTSVRVSEYILGKSLVQHHQLEVGA
ncbi:MAG TPA: hypothetical protein VKA15_22435 [Isosphaeraceae bacterium]|nr:hypothetical protein [Isosphaeraceae bacterium]